MRRLLILVATIAVPLMLFGIPAATAHGEAASHFTIGPGEFGAAHTAGLEARYASLGPANPDVAPMWHPADDADFGVEFQCDTGIGGQGQAVVDGSACPLLLWDIHDAMSQPLLAIDPLNDEYQAFSAMHGGRGIHSPLAPQPPSDQSRHNALHQPHTMFRSAGSGWEDWPYYAPEQVVKPGRTIFGEDNGIVMDSKGNIYLGGILAMQDQEDEDYRYRLVVYKEGRVNRQPSYLEPTFFETETPHGIMSQLQMTYVRQTDQVVVMWNEQAKNEPDAEPGRYTTRVIYSSPSGSSQWQEIRISERFGPCQTVSNMAVWKHVVYAACAPARGYGFDVNITPDLVQVHSIDTTRWTTAHTSQTALRADGHLQLIDWAGGNQIIMSSGVDANGKPFALVSFGQLGDLWDNPDDYGKDLHQTSGVDRNVKLADARITAAVHNDQSSTIHIIWSERYELDPTDPDTANTLSLYKTYAVLRKGGNFLGNMDLGYGKTATFPAVNPVYQGGNGDRIFRDAHDSIVLWENPRKGDDRIYVAFGDYGFVRWAQVVEQNPPPFLPVPPTAIPPIPLAAATTTASTATAALGALTGLMLLRLLSAKKKVRVEAPTL